MSVFDGMAEIITGTFNPAEPIYLIRAGEDAIGVDGVFVRDYRDAASEFAGVEDRVAALTVKSADAAGVEATTGRVEHDGVIYKVASVQPDSKGLTRLILKKHGLAAAGTTSSPPPSSPPVSVPPASEQIIDGGTFN